MLNIQSNTAEPEDVELMMKYYCHLYDTKEAIPRELSGLISRIFEDYLDRKSNKQFYGALEAAFGLTGKQGNRNTDKRNFDIATDVARHYLSGRTVLVTNAVMKVTAERDLGRTTVTNAWKENKYHAVTRIEQEFKKKRIPISARKQKFVEREKGKFDEFLRTFLDIPKLGHLRQMPFYFPVK
jgi:hypothetical protein